MIKVSDGGTLYLEPPYNDEERAYIKKYTSGPPIGLYHQAPVEPAAPPPEPPKPNLSRRRLAEMRRAARELTGRLPIDPSLAYLLKHNRLNAKAYLGIQGVPEEQLGFDEQRTLNLLRELERPARERRRRDR